MRKAHNSGLVYNREKCCWLSAYQLDALPMSSCFRPFSNSTVFCGGKPGRLIRRKCNATKSSWNKTRLISASHRHIACG
jgi:hypothetical protein